MTTYKLNGRYQSLESVKSYYNRLSDAGLDNAYADLQERKRMNRSQEHDALLMALCASEIQERFEYQLIAIAEMDVSDYWLHPHVTEDDIPF